MQTIIFGVTKRYSQTNKITVLEYSIIAWFIVTALNEHFKKHRGISFPNTLTALIVSYYLTAAL